MSLCVVGAGQARTGTTSTREALAALGFDPAYHMFELFTSFHHVPWWNAAFDGTLDHWDRIYDGYRSTVDWPGALFWRELADAYPEARVLLTVRPPEQWLASFDATVLAVARSMVVPPGPPGDVVRLIQRCLHRAVGDDLDSPETLVARYEAHNRAVVDAFAGDDRLLVYDVADGWEPLCAWLGVPVPDEPFPRLNTRHEFRQALALDPVAS